MEGGSERWHELVSVVVYDREREGGCFLEREKEREYESLGEGGREGGRER
jgi:hypothetical protein